MTEIKICGLKREEDIRYVNRLRPEMAGFVFAKKSSRFLTQKQGAVLRKKLDPGICRVCIRQYPKNTQKPALQGRNESTDRRVRTLFLYMPLKLQSAHWSFLRIFCRMKVPKNTGGFHDEKHL